MGKTNWRTLAAELHSLPESTVKAMLEEELGTHRRPAIVRRLHQRYASLRTMREREEIMEGLKN